jgi:diadenylate cyclase
MGERVALVRDYSVGESDEQVDRILQELAGLPHQELLDFGRLAELLGYERKTSTVDFNVSPRGYRALSRIPRLPRLVVQKVVYRFGDLDAIVNAREDELASVDGVGEARAREIREGLRSLQEVDIVDRYP